MPNSKPSSTQIFVWTVVVRVSSRNQAELVNSMPRQNIHVHKNYKRGRTCTAPPMPRCVTCVALYDWGGGKVTVALFGVSWSQPIFLRSYQCATAHLIAG